MDLAAVVLFVVEHGIMPIVTAVFLYSFLKRDKNRDERDKKREDYLVERDKSYAQTINQCIKDGSENTEKVINIVMDASSKREAMMMSQLNAQGEIMKEVTSTLAEIRNEIRTGNLEINMRLSNLENSKKV